MGRLRKTSNDWRKDVFSREFRLYKALLGKTDVDIAADMGISRRVLTDRKKAPWEFRVEEFCKIVATWPDDAILAFVKGEKYERKGIA